MFFKPGSRFLTLALLGTFGTALGFGAAQAQEPAKSLLGNFHASLDFVTESNFYEWDSPNHSLESALLLAPSFQFGKKDAPEYTASALFGVSRVYNIYEENQFLNPKLGLRRKALPMGRFFGFSPGIGAALPLNDESIKKDSYLGSVSLAPRLTFDLAKTNRNPFSKLSGHLQLTVNRNFHEYTRKRGGASNIEYSLTPLFSIVYAPLEPLALTSSLSRTVSFTYTGSVSHGFEFNEELSYELSRFFSASLGLNIKGNAYKENGIDSNVSFFDGDRSTVFGSIGIRI